MKSRDNLLRLKHFQVQDRTRQLAQIDMMIHEMTRMSDDLQAQIRIEEEKSGISDVSHFAYPTFAKAARQRHENLLVSIRDLNDKRQAAEDALGEAEEDLKKDFPTNVLKLARAVSPFDQAGVQTGDRIVLDQSPQQFVEMLRQNRGQAVSLSVIDDAASQEISSIESATQREVVVQIPP